MVSLVLIMVSIGSCSFHQKPPCGLVCRLYFQRYSWSSNLTMGEAVISAIYTIKCEESNERLRPPNESRCNEGLNFSQYKSKAQTACWEGVKEPAL